MKTKINRREFAKKACATSLMIVVGRLVAHGNTPTERTENMKFNDLIEARRSVRKYAKSEMPKVEMEAIVAEALNAPSWKNTETTRYYAAVGDQAKNRGWDSLIMGIRDEKKVRDIFGIPDNEILMSVIAVGKSAQPYYKNPRKPVAEVLKIS